MGRGWIFIVITWKGRQGFKHISPFSNQKDWKSRKFLLLLPTPMVVQIQDFTSTYKLCFTFALQTNEGRSNIHFVVSGDKQELISYSFSYIYKSLKLTFTSIALCFLTYIKRWQWLTSIEMSQVHSYHSYLMPLHCNAFPGYLKCQT